jgi:hypothetical protein
MIEWMKIWINPKIWLALQESNPQGLQEWVPTKHCRSACKHNKSQDSVSYWVTINQIWSVMVSDLREQPEAQEWMNELVDRGAGVTVEAGVPGVTGQAIGWAGHKWWTGGMVYMCRGSHDKPLGVGIGDDVQPEPFVLVESIIQFLRCIAKLQECVGRSRMWSMIIVEQVGHADGPYVLPYYVEGIVPAQWLLDVYVRSVLRPSSGSTLYSGSSHSLSVTY